MKQKNVLTIATALVVGMTSVGFAQSSSIGKAPLLKPATAGNVAVTTIVGGNQSDEPAAAATSAPAATPAPAAAPAAARRGAEEQAESTFRKSVGEDEVLPVRGAKTIAVSNQGVLTASVMANGQAVLVSAKGRGTSDVRIFTDDGVRVFRFVVSGANLEEELKMVRELLTDVVGVNADKSGDAIVCRGRITSNEDNRKYRQIIDRFDVIDLVEVRVSLVEQERALAELNKKLNERNYSTVKAQLVTDPSGDVGVWLTGVVYTDQAKGETEEIAGMYFQRIMNHVGLEKRMVEIDVTLVTVDLNKTNDRGPAQGPYSNVDVAVGNTLGKVSPFADADADPGSAGEFGSEGLFGSSDGTDWSDANLDFRLLSGVKSLQFLKSKRYTTYYGEQHQSVVSGETAQFQDGNTIYVPLVGSETAGLATIETGLSVQVRPEILENTKIKTDVTVDLVAASQSETPSFSSEDGDSSQASLQLKKFNSTSTLTGENGQTIVVSGVNSNLFGMTKDSTPLLEQIPIINLVFKKQARRGTNVRSFFFITPEVPNTYEEAGRRAYSATAPQAKQYYKSDSAYREGNWAFYLGWAKDVPMPPEPTPAPEEHDGTKDFIDKIEF
jgi:hypothetical protein